MKDLISNPVGFTKTNQRRDLKNSESFGKTSRATIIASEREQSSIESISKASKIEAKSCHWCGEELHGLLVEFIHCVRCNERRLIEGLDQTFDACPYCMAVKSRKLDFLNPDNEKNGGINHD